MKTVNAAVSNAIRKDYAVNARPRLVAEWNMNRHYSPTAKNIPDEDTDGFDIEVFPIESIVEPIRPSKGILKARTDEALVTDLDRSGTSRYYSISDNDVYKYWTSPAKTNGSGAFTTTVRPHIIYDEDVMVNKLVIKIENFWATPSAFTIKTSSVAAPAYPGDWTTRATNPTINNKGEITLYWNGTAWSSTKPSLINPPMTTIRGVMIDVTAMGAGRDLNGNVTTYHKAIRSGNNWVETDYNTTGANSFFNLIEISARREVDITEYLISVSDEFDTSEVSNLYPIGTLTSNGGSITLSNIYTDNGVSKVGYFNNDNTPLKGLIQPNVEFDLEYIYTIAGNEYPVQQFHLYGEDFTGQLSEEVTVSLVDASKHLEAITPPAAMYEDMTVPQLFQRVLDISGFVDWVLDEDDRVVKHIIPVFWIDGEKNTWEILNDLATATQTAIYFDSFGKLQIKTRETAFDKLKSPTWTLRGNNSGDELADIISIEDNGEIGANKLTVTYHGTRWDNYNNGTPYMQKVWEPEGTTVLRSTQLSRTLNNDDAYFWMPPADARIWPYEGLVQIEGEIIKYAGKRFIYYTGANGATQNTVVVKSQDEHKKYNSKTLPVHRHKNYFDGAFFIPVIDGSRDNARGYWNSEKRIHKTDISNYNVRRLFYSGGVALATPLTGGLQHFPGQSLVRLNSHPTATGNDATVAQIGEVGGTGYRYYGTKFKFVKESGLTDQRAGIIINSRNGDDGYYIELQANIDTKDRARRNELTIFTQKGGSFGTKMLSAGTEVAVVPDKYYELDVILSNSGSNHVITVMLDGKTMLVANVASAGTDFQANSGRLGMFVRGKTKADFEYLYAVARTEKDPSDDASFFNVKEGGFTGEQFIREWVWGWKTRKKRKKKKWTKERYRWNQYFFDEFGPIIHEVREFNVTFDPNPVKHSRLYMSNDWDAICTEYNSSPFGARFVLTNVARNNAVVNGEDNLTFGGTRAVPQILTVIGRVLVIEEAETVVVKDEQSIKERGAVEAELDSQWIQSKTMANDIANWMKSHWSQGLDSLNVTIFGNPLIEIGDIVSIDYSERHLSADTHKYFVVGASTTFSQGIETELTLHRALI